jgi:hypothetical protein
LARSFYAEKKRVSNRKLKDALGVKLAFPTYRVGLEALWEVGGDSVGLTLRRDVQPNQLPYYRESSTRDITAAM